MTDAATVPTTEPSTNGAGTRQQRLAAAVKNLRTRQSLSSIPVDRWVLIAGAIMVPLGIALIVLGPKRLPEAGRSVGKGLREFKESLSGDRRDSCRVGVHLGCHGTDRFPWCV